ncbi:hypothetical protein HanXRQr2_Chr16g0770671 [Helianthus annuus]|uniref:Uncharacterized protein n=1 Tax=Helianthus annuus TaxID=4232 RepID=A0A9K3GZQ1_HELAN|nr:hypothetical protein HanXRQr2_Chr16g0770671 [Helianthus annuus]KAJ0823022.1 hypothetical protein HanPSC8_Chr16g0738801 [Helianthus annuus]
MTASSQVFSYEVNFAKSHTLICTQQRKTLTYEPDETEIGKSNSRWKRGLPEP